MELYSGPLSLFSAKVRIALDEKSIPHECVDVPWSATGGCTPKHPMVERINPKLQVPVLVDGDVELYDSTIILEYLESSLPGRPSTRAHAALAQDAAGSSSSRTRCTSRPFEISSE